MDPIEITVYSLAFQVDPRTEKPSPHPSAQRELHQHGPLPVRFSRRDTCSSLLTRSRRHTGKFARYPTVEFTTSITVRATRFAFFSHDALIAVNKTTTWTDPRVAGPVRVRCEGNLSTLFVHPCDVVVIVLDVRTYILCSRPSDSYFHVCFCVFDLNMLITCSVHREKPFSCLGGTVLTRL